MTSSPLPEIRESDAAPHIAEIYADIKQSAALPQVNLIFRYLATKEGVLEWVWQALRPLYRSNELAQSARDLTHSIDRPGLSPLATALTGDDLASAKNVIDSYNSGNPQNLLALTAFVRAMNQHPEPQTSPAIALTPRAVVLEGSKAPFAALPKRDELSRETMALVEKMAARHPRAPGVTPSMYLHLALWPPALEAADIYLQPIIESPGWAPLVATVIEQAARTADGLAPSIKLSASAPDAATLSEATDTIEAFIRTTIPELITVGRLLAVE